jgi:hypothetical protein
MAQFESLLWERHARRRRTRILDSDQPAIDPRVEFTGQPPGRLGRPLLDEIEAYLSFFALARSGPPDES